MSRNETVFGSFKTQDSRHKGEDGQDVRSAAACGGVRTGFGLSSVWGRAGFGSRGWVGRAGVGRIGFVSSGPGDRGMM